MNAPEIIHVYELPGSSESLCWHLERLNILTACVHEWKVDPLTSLKNSMKVPYASIHALSHALLVEPLSNRPDLQTKIAHFRDAYPHHIACVSECSWNELKAIHKDAMMDSFANTGCSLSSFRQSANACIDEISLELGKNLGLQSAVWTVCGTSGYSSDVDITLKMGDGLPNVEEAVLYKTLRDCLHTYILGGLSGVQLDTECYIPHPAQINIPHYLHFPKSFRFFHTGEKACVLLQQYISLHKIGAEYEISKRMNIAGITNQGEKEAIELLYNKIEALMQLLEGEIQKHLHDLSYKEARELAFVPLRIRLAERCSFIQQEIDKESKNIRHLSSHDMPNSKESLICAQKKLDSLWLEFQSILIIVGILQNEGTISVAEGRATLLEEGGQMHAGAIRARQNSISEFYQGSPEVLDELAKTPQFRRKASLPLQATLGAAHAGISDEYARIVLGKDVEEMLRPVFARPTGQTFLMAAYEESMQLQHVVLGGLARGDMPGVVAIASGKYALRVTRNLYQALKEFKKEPLCPKGVLTLLARAEKLEKISECLEKCKRETSINSEAATILLTDAILRNLSGRGSVDEIDVKTKVHRMFRDFDFGGIYFGRLVPQEEHLRILCNTLEKSRELFIDVSNPEILQILQAHAGFDRFNPLYRHLSSIHQQAEKSTLESLNLVAQVQVKQFLDDILQLGCEIRNMALEHGLFTVSTVDMASFYDFAEVIAQSDTRAALLHKF